MTTMCLNEDSSGPWIHLLHNGVDGAMMVCTTSPRSSSSSSDNLYIHHIETNSGGTLNISSEKNGIDRSFSDNGDCGLVKEKTNDHDKESNCIGAGGGDGAIGGVIHDSGGADADVDDGSVVDHVSPLPGTDADLAGIVGGSQASSSSTPSESSVAGGGGSVPVTVVKRNHRKYSHSKRLRHKRKRQSNGEVDYGKCGAHQSTLIVARSTNSSTLTNGDSGQQWSSDDNNNDMARHRENNATVYTKRRTTRSIGGGDDNELVVPQQLGNDSFTVTLAQCEQNQRRPMKQNNYDKQLNGRSFLQSHSH